MEIPPEKKAEAVEITTIDKFKEMHSFYQYTAHVKEWIVFQC